MLAWVRDRFQEDCRYRLQPLLTQLQSEADKCTLLADPAQLNPTAVRPLYALGLEYFTPRLSAAVQDLVTRIMEIKPEAPPAPLYSVA